MRVLELAVRYFKQLGYDVERDVILRGKWGVKYRFDLLLRWKDGSIRGVWVREWRRAVGINVAIRLDRASEDIALGKPVLVAYRFSPSVYMYASRRGIELLTVEDMLSVLKAPVLASPKHP